MQGCSRARQQKSEKGPARPNEENCQIEGFSSTEGFLVEEFPNEISQEGGRHQARARRKDAIW